MPPAPNPHDFTRPRTAPPAVAAGGSKSCVVALTAAKDGAGRTTLAAHLAVAALQLGLNAGVVDLDVADRGLTRWLRRRAAASAAGAERGSAPHLESAALRAAGAERGSAPHLESAALCAAGAELVMPSVVQGEARDAEGERARWPAVAEAMRRSCALVFVDAPAGAGALAREVIARADRVLTLVPDNPAELDRLVDVDGRGRDTGRPSAYARMIWDERLDRARGDRSVLDWRLVRAHALPGMARGETDRFADALRRLGAHEAPSLYEHPAWRRGFAEGLTALDLPAVDPARVVVAEVLRDLLIALRAPGLEGVRLAL